MDYDNQPVIEVKVAYYHPIDLRDKMLQRFFDGLQKDSGKFGYSRWFKKEPQGSCGGEQESGLSWADHTIYPVTPSELETEAIEMLKAGRQNPRPYKVDHIFSEEIVVRVVASKLGIGSWIDNKITTEVISYILYQKFKNTLFYTAEQIEVRISRIVHDEDLMSTLRRAVSYAVNNETLPMLETNLIDGTDEWEVKIKT